MRRNVLCLTLLGILAFASVATAERVQLPNDAGKPYVTVYGSQYDARFQRVKKSLRALDPNAAHYHAIAIESPRFQLQYAKGVRGVPAIYVQQGNTVLLELRGAALDCTPAELGQRLNCPLRRHHEEPQPEPEHNHALLWAALGAAFCGAMLVFAVRIQRIYHSAR
jgi:hypothetical protein